MRASEPQRVVSVGDHVVFKTMIVDDVGCSPCVVANPGEAGIVSAINTSHPRPIVVQKGDGMTSVRVTRNEVEIDNSEQPDHTDSMPKYRCHKEVWALKIAKLEPSAGDRVAGPQDETDGGMIMTPDNEQYGPIKLDADYVRKHKPQVGGYYVVYSDGYKSWSPAEAFEDGYTVME